MRKLSTISSIIFSLFLVFSCDNPAEEVQPEVQDELSRRSFMYKSSKVTGFIQIAFKGKGGKGTVEDKYVFASFAAHESVKQKPAKGFFVFTVWKADFTQERKIVAKVTDVGFGDGDEKKAWIFAEVTSDSKCETSDHASCSDSDHTDGGCSHDDEDSTHDGGCSHDTGTEHDDSGTTHDDTGAGGGCDHDDTGTVHDDTGTGGGCDHDDTGTVHDDTGTDGGCDHDDTGTVHDDTGTDGGCDHDDTETDTGCDHDDSETDHDSGSGGKPDDKGGKGKQCRVGQYIVAKMHDKGSPGTKDGITWKWFESLDGFSVENEPGHLCKKEILSGNLTVHLAQN